MERLLDQTMNLLLKPAFIKGLGKVCISSASLAIVVGFIVLTVNNLNDNLHITAPALTNGNAVLPQPVGLFGHWPLLNAFIPETTGAFCLYAALFITGLMLRHMGKWIERAY